VDNPFSIARACFDDPIRYSIVTTRATVYSSLLNKNHIDNDEYIGFIEELRNSSKHLFLNENLFAVNSFFNQLKNISKNR